MLEEITNETFEPLDFADLVTNTPCVVVKFTGSFCGPCKSKEFKQNYAILKNKFSDQENTIKFLELDIDEFEELIENKEYYDINVESVPYFKVSYNGAWIKDYKGTSCIQDIENLLNKVLEKQSQKEEITDNA